MTIVKFPYNASRRVFSRRGRVSKTGTPEERAAKATADAAKAMPATVIEMSRRSAARPILSGDEFVAKMACLDQDSRQVIVDYMNLLLGKRST